MHNKLTRIEGAVAGDISYLVVINAVCNDRLYNSGGYRDERNERLWVDTTIAITCSATTVYEPLMT